MIYHEYQKNVIRLRKETYVKIYEQISKKIRQSVELSHKHVFVQIPSFVIGHPHFDRTKATNYISKTTSHRWIHGTTRRRIRIVYIMET